jgi:hypothetical protein
MFGQGRNSGEVLTKLKKGDEMMKIFEKDRRVNFVDENNVLVGFDMNQNCCEYFGWFISRKKEKEIKDDIQTPDVSGYVFDPNFFEEVFNENEFGAGGMVIFRLVRGDKEFFLHLYNSHNGYYSHGFNMEVRGKTIKEDCL